MATQGLPSPVPGLAQGSHPELIRIEPHRPVGPIIFLEDILHTIFAPIREHHDHLIAVSPSDVGLVKGEQSQAVLGLSQAQGRASLLW